MIVRKSEQPTKGQFVAIWIYNGVPWCDTFEIDADGILRRYETESDSFEIIMDEAWPAGFKVSFFVNEDA